MKVLHLSDFHIDLTYTQGALVDCQVFNESIILLKKIALNSAIIF